MSEMKFNLQRFTEEKYGTSGSDNIQNYNSDVIIYGYEGDDEIRTNMGSNITVYGDAGNDTIFAYGDGSDIMLYGGTGDDSVYVYGGSEDSKIFGGTGNDTIIMLGGDFTINAGEDNDYIEMSGYTANVFQYSNGDGNDTIVGYNTGESANKKIQIAGSYSTTTSGNDAVINVGAGSILIKDAANVSLSIEQLTTEDTGDTVVTALSIDNTVDNTIISGTAANDTIVNSGENVTINAGAGNDSIHNNGEYALLNGDDGDDTIVSYSYGGITINGGEGNDILSDNNGLNIINGDDGDDSINSGGTDNTIYGGAGNDTILAEGMSVAAYGGEGDDFISTAATVTIQLIFPTVMQSALTTV